MVNKDFHIVLRKYLFCMLTKGLSYGIKFSVRISRLWLKHTLSWPLQIAQTMYVVVKS